MSSDITITAPSAIPAATLERVWPSVYIIVLTWNQSALTLACLQSLQATTYANAHVIVVDNGSHDGTADSIRLHFPAVSLIANPENLGFVQGNNQGIAQALAGGADYVMLLNNDTVVDPGMLSDILAVAESDATIGIVGPTICYFDPPDVIWGAGARVDWRTGDTYRLHANEKDDAAQGVPYEVEFVGGCALCIKRQVIERIGLLDERFFIYYEETDWCIRTKSAGYRCVVAPRGKIWHKVSAAMGEGTAMTVYYMSRNRLLFLTKHLRGRRRLSAFVRALGRQICLVVRYTILPQYRHLHPQRNARIHALIDFFLRRFGKCSYGW